MQRTVMTGQVSTFCPVHGTLVNKHVVSYHWRIKKSPSGGGGYVGLGGGVEVINVFLQRATRTSVEKQLDPGPIVSRWGSVPVFLSKHIKFFDYPEGEVVRPPAPCPTLDPLRVTLVNVKAPVVATTSWWWQFSALVLA